MMTKTSAGKSPAKSAAPAATRAKSPGVPPAKPTVVSPAKPTGASAAKTTPAPAMARTTAPPAAKPARAAKAPAQSGAKAPAKSAPQRGAPTRAPASEPAYVHPRSVANVVPDADAAPEQVFASGAADEINPELRYRMISDIAYRRYVDRGYADGGDVDDWLQAEAEVEHLLATRGRPADDGG